jgi:peptide/nickel transport system permease protein
MPLSGRWFINRLTAGLVALIAAMVINFAIPRLMPGTAVDEMFTGGTQLTDEVRQALLERFGLDKPVWVQFWHYMVNSLKGDFGLSFTFYPMSVWEAILNALPWTVLVFFSSLIIQIIIGYVLGVTAAWNVGKKLDAILQTISMTIFSTPLFWLAMVLLYVFGFWLEWVPLGGRITVGAIYDSTFEVVMDIARHAALPIVTLTISRYAAYQLILRNTMVSVLKEQYIVTAEAKGLSPRRVKHRHAARNALLPMITYVALSMATTIGGSVFIETVFSYQGIGKLIYDSVTGRDYPLLQGCFFMFSSLVIMANFIVDIIYMYLDPRIRY